MRYISIILLLFTFTVHASVVINGPANQPTSSDAVLPAQTGNNGKVLGTNGTTASWTTVAGTGDFVGPASSTDNGFVKFDGTTGKLAKNSAATIANADISASAAIAHSKLANLTSANIFVGNASNVPTGVAVSGDIAITNAGVTSYSGTVPVAKGGTAVTSVTTAPAATSFAGWDASSNLSANSFITGYATTATAAGTTTLTVASKQLQYFTGSTTQTVVLPVTSTMVLGQAFTIVNNSSGVVTVQSSGANTIQAMAASTVATFTVILASGTTAASWNTTYQSNTLAAGGSVPTTWHVKAKITANADFTLAAASNGGLLESTNTGTETLTPFAGSAAVGLTCDSTNAALAPSTSATVSSSCGGSHISSRGINFTIPTADVYEVCVSGSVNLTGSSGNSDTLALSLVETPTNAQTHTTESNVFMEWRAYDTATFNAIEPFFLCGVFDWTGGTGTKAVRLMYQNIKIGGSGGGNQIMAASRYNLQFTVKRAL